ncbi:MAG: hypothetical protein ACPGU4_12035 [Flavobacteriales bacterium]
MKSKLFLFALLAGVTMSTVACKKCQTCTVPSQTVETEVCRDDYGSPQLYDAQILALESAGYECN